MEHEFSPLRYLLADLTQVQNIANERATSRENAASKVSLLNENN